MTVIDRLFSAIGRRLGRRLNSQASPDPRVTAEPVLQQQSERRIRDLTRTLSSELFAHLLIELPAYRKDLSGFHQSGDIEGLGACTHKLLGAVAYCDAPDLLHGLSGLQQALKSGDDRAIDFHYTQAINIIDKILADSGQH